MLFAALLFSCWTETETIPTADREEIPTVIEETKKLEEKMVRKNRIEKTPSHVLPSPPKETAIPDSIQPVATKEEIKPSSEKTVQSSRIQAPEEVAPTEQAQEPKAEKKMTTAPKKSRRFTKPGPKCVQTIKKVLRRKNGDVRSCYDQQKVKNPDLEGKITLQINVYGNKNSMRVKGSNEKL